VTGEIREMFPDRFCRFMPVSFHHTLITGGLLYPFLPFLKDRFYSEEISGVKLYQWVNKLMEGTCLDLVEGQS